MGWKIIDRRLAWEENETLQYPTASEIFKLRSGDFSKKDNGGYIYGDFDVSEIRFARIGGKIVLRTDFDEISKNIVLKVFALKGTGSTNIEYKEGNLPDSIVMENVWYNLLSNHADVAELLKKAGIREDGKIALGQYIRLRKLLKSYSGVELKDYARTVLSNHPVKGESEKMPDGLNAVLYPYQQTGYHWMKFITDEKIGCILGDEMGLGKTLQIIALITDRRDMAKTPALVVAPVSLLENWRREFKKFTPDLNVFVHHGVKRTGLYSDLLSHDVVIISYSTASSDQSILRMVNWDLLVVDEAQNIKNPSAQRTKSIKRIPRDVAVAVTGTPFENHMSDLWSIMDFVAPGCLGTLSEFEEAYPDDMVGAELLEPVLTPLMIRRRVAEVAQDLPQRVDILQTLQMSQKEINMYEEERQKIISNFDGKNASLPMIQKLRMFCTHPLLLSEEEKTDPITDSSKYRRLCELMEEIISLKEKMILFTSYNKMFEILREDIPLRFGIRVLEINGSTPQNERQHVIDDFSHIAGSSLLVLNPRAAGAGLNITAASRVIHYNPEWNPALEDQASARAYRRGQTKTVFVYRLYYKSTVEEIISERIDRKREMFEAAIIGVDGNSENSKDILKALQISPRRDENG
ncbi:DEAD/DEAH box helicase [Lachnospiraceae bacterium 38-10]